MDIREFAKVESEKRFRKTLGRDTFSSMANKMAMHDSKVYSDGLINGLEIALDYGKFCLRHSAKLLDGDENNLEKANSSIELLGIYLSERYGCR